MTKKEKTDLENKVKKFKLSKKIALSLVIGAASLFGNVDKADACGSFRSYSYYYPSFRYYRPHRYYFPREFGGYGFYRIYPYRDFNGCW